MTRNLVAIGLNAISNASKADVTEETLFSVLRTGNGSAAMVRALFGDCSLETLDGLAAEAGMTRSALEAAYATAKTLHAAANADFDEPA